MCVKCEPTGKTAELIGDSNYIKLVRKPRRDHSKILYPAASRSGVCDNLLQFLMDLRRQFSSTLVKYAWTSPAAILEYLEVATNAVIPELCHISDADRE
ncbi:hypothetical protein Trydic_g19804 [Trypoxylus dichotomus]